MYALETLLDRGWISNRFEKNAAHFHHTLSNSQSNNTHHTYSRKATLYPTKGAAHNLQPSKHSLASEILMGLFPMRHRWWVIAAWAIPGLQSIREFSLNRFGFGGGVDGFATFVYFVAPDNLIADCLHLRSELMVTRHSIISEQPPSLKLIRHAPGPAPFFSPCPPFFP